MKKITKIVMGLGLGTIASFAPAAANVYSKPDMYVVMFRADWCGPCRIVEPRLHKALQNLSDPKIEYVTIDISNPALSEASAHRAFDREIVPQYNNWLGVTGFAAIIDGDTKRTLGCVNMMYDVGAMTRHIGNLKTFADANRTASHENKPVEDVTCPEPNNRPRIR